MIIVFTLFGKTRRNAKNNLEDADHACTEQCTLMLCHPIPWVRLTSVDYSDAHNSSYEVDEKLG